jgi:hypothetical protein
MKRLELGNVARLYNRPRRLKWGFSREAKNHSVNVIRYSSSGAMLVIEVFTSSADLPYPERDSSPHISFLSEMRLQLCHHLVRVKALLHGKFDDNSLLQFYQDKRSTSPSGIFTFRPTDIKSLRVTWKSSSDIERKEAKELETSSIVGN